MTLSIETAAEVSSKVVFKENAAEKVGVLALVDGKCGIVEYSDMPADMAAERAADGSLAFKAGNPAIHLFAVEFLERVTTGRQRRDAVSHPRRESPGAVESVR